MSGGQEVGSSNLPSPTKKDLVTGNEVASLALQAGVHPKVVQEQLGHSGSEITMDIYSHVPESMKQDAAEGIAGLFEAIGDG